MCLPHPTQCLDIYIININEITHIHTYIYVFSVFSPKRILSYITHLPAHLSANLPGSKTRFQEKLTKYCRGRQRGKPLCYVPQPRQLEVLTLWLRFKASLRVTTPLSVGWEQSYTGLRHQHRYCI